jgi:hypothetical protein
MHRGEGVDRDRDEILSRLAQVRTVRGDEHNSSH